MNDAVEEEPSPGGWNEKGESYAPGGELGSLSMTAATRPAEGCRPTRPVYPYPYPYPLPTPPPP